MPDIHAHANLKDETDVMDRVHKERKSRGVVIYATNDLYDKLSDKEEVTVVKYNTDDDLLQKLDVKGEGGYPVYLVNDQYGIRGLDFRARKNPLGIC